MYRYTGTASVYNAWDVCWLNCALFTEVAAAPGEEDELYVPWMSERPQRIDLPLGEQVAMKKDDPFGIAGPVNRRGDLMEDGLPESLYDTLRMKLGKKLQGRRPA